MSIEEVDSLEKLKRLETKEKLDKLIRHIRNVQEACQLLGSRLIERGEIELGIKLVQSGLQHDASKFSGIEWDYLIEGNFNGEAKLAAKHHARTNKSHPEYWGDDINQMPRLYVAEFVCDIYARATEFGTDVWEYFKDKAIPRYKIPPRGKIYKWVREFLSLLLDKPFEQSPADE